MEEAKKKVSMNLLELQSVLGDRVKVTLKEDLTPEERQEENEQSRLVVSIAKQMINTADIVLRTEKLLAQQKNLENSYAMQLISG